MRAQVVLDGSLGTAGPRVGPNYVVPASVGRLAGSNLFHSFSQFNVNQGESLTFTAPSDVTVGNVLARVTGGSPSNINGLLRSSIPGANLYLINPSGVVFGPEAQLDVSGSFAVTTADLIKLADSGRFDATASPDVAVLTTANPVAFGFLAAQPAAITYDGGGATAGLTVPDGAVLSVVGGNVRITGGTLRSVSGRVNVASVASPGEVVIDPASVDAPLTLNGFTSLGGTELLDRSAINVQEGGRAVLRGGSLDVNRSTVSAFTQQRAGGAVDLDYAGNVNLLNARINSETQGPAAGASVAIKGGAIVIQGLSDDALAPISTNTIDTGAGGNVSIDATASLTISQDASIQTFTSSSAPGGRIDVRAPGGTVHIDGTGSAFVTGLAAETLVASDGPAGAINVSAGVVEIVRQGEITSTTRGNGPAGQITIVATDRFTVDGGNSTLLTGIQSRVGDLDGIGAAGDGGAVDVTTGNALELINGGVLSASTFGRGNGGDVNVDVANGAVTISGSDPGVFTGIFARSTLPVRGGAGGSVTVNAKSIDINGPAQISAISTGDGVAGDLIVTAAQSVQLIDGGSLTVQAGFDDPRDDQPAPPTPPLTDAGSITLTAGKDITLRGDAMISARATQDSGQVKITAPGIIRVVDSDITAEAGRTGGVIDIDPRAVVLDNSVINGLAAGQDVRVSITADVFLTSESQILTDTAVLPPEVDIAGSLVRLPAGLANDAARLQEICGLRAGADVSSFVVSGRGGTPITPGGFAPAMLLAHPRK